MAEELVFGLDKVTNGASNDIAQATLLARKMVTEWGMSEKLGPLCYNENQEEIFLGHSVTQTKNVSEATAQVIDEEVREIVESAESACRKILTDNLADLHTLANALLEYETLSGDEIIAILNGESIVRDSGDNDAPSSGARSSVPSSGPVGLDPKPQPES